jgi:XTP/dITP diphosphohydrolase
MAVPVLEASFKPFSLAALARYFLKTETDNSLAFDIMTRVTTLFLATRNTHKAAEISAILGTQFQFLTLNDFPAAPKVVEDAKTFAENATKKSFELARWLVSAGPWSTIHDSTVFILADDSGLEVDALNGAPGVHSARFAALDKNENSTDAENNAKLLRLLKHISTEKRTARFRSVLALMPVLNEKIKNASSVCYADEFESQTELFNGVCEGKIAFETRGQNGFGYDPLFVPDGFAGTFAELGEDVKNQLSHRAKALQKLRQYLA